MQGNVDIKEELGVCRHIVLYSKYHYRKNTQPEDTIEGLRVVQSHICGVKPQAVSDYDLITKLIDILSTLNYDFENLMREVSLGIGTIRTNNEKGKKGIIYILLSKLTLTDNTTNLGKVDEEIQDKLQKLPQEEDKECYNWL